MKKAILILGAGEEQTIAIKLAKQIGIKVIAADANTNAIGLDIADIGICMDIRDTKKLIEIGRKYNINGVFCHAVEIPQVVAKIAKELNLPGISPEVAERATNKLKRLKCFKKNGIPCPEFKTAINIEEAKRKAKELGFPVVMKPLNNSGSRGVTKVNTINEIENAFEGALIHSDSKTLLVEKYIKGFEISTESIVCNNKIYTTALSDRNYPHANGEEVYFIEDGGNMPTSLNKKEQKKVKRAIEKAINSLGIDFGGAKGDILIKNKKIYFLEMAARTSGGFFCSVQTPLSNGINILKPLIQMSVNMTPNEEELSPSFSRGAVERYIYTNKKGTIKAILGIEEAKKMPGIKYLKLFDNCKRGNDVKKLKDNTGKLGIIIAVAKERKEAIKRVENAMKKIEIEVE